MEAMYVSGFSNSMSLIANIERDADSTLISKWIWMALSKMKLPGTMEINNFSFFSIVVPSFALICD